MKLYRLVWSIITVLVIAFLGAFCAIASATEVDVFVTSSEVTLGKIHETYNIPALNVSGQVNTRVGQAGWNSSTNRMIRAATAQAQASGVAMPKVTIHYELLWDRFSPFSVPLHPSAADLTPLCTICVGQGFQGRTVRVTSYSPLLCCVCDRGHGAEAVVSLTGKNDWGPFKRVSWIASDVVESFKVKETESRTRLVKEKAKRPEYCEKCAKSGFECVVMKIVCGSTWAISKAALESSGRQILEDSESRGMDLYECARGVHLCQVEVIQRYYNGQPVSLGARKQWRSMSLNRVVVSSQKRSAVKQGRYGGFARQSVAGSLDATLPLEEIPGAQ